MKTFMLSDAAAADLGVLLSNLTPKQIADASQKCAALYAQAAPAPAGAVLTDYEMRFNHVCNEVTRQLRVRDNFESQCG